MTKKSKAAVGIPPGLIDLKPGEVSVLSLVAEYAKYPAIKPQLVKTLRRSTPRAQRIGTLILKKSNSRKSKYKVMADRFLQASSNNVKNARALKASTPPGLWVDRGL
jgi:hypothetical protein